MADEVYEGAIGIDLGKIGKCAHTCTLAARLTVHRNHILVRRQL